MTVLTAYTQSHAELMRLQRESCIKCGIEPDRHIAVPIPDHYPKHPSWFRVRALLDHLHHHEHILWMDADSIMLQPSEFNGLLGGVLTTTMDHNGINNGVGIWHRTPKAFELLWRMYDMHPRFKDHPWHEQGTLHVLAEQYPIQYAPMHILNARPNGITADSIIYHVPNLPMKKQIELLKERMP